MIEIGEGERKTGFTMVLNRLAETTDFRHSVHRSRAAAGERAQVRIEAAGYESDH